MLKYISIFRLSLCFLLTNQGICQSIEHDKIVHLNLMITSDKIELLSTKITSGKLKSIHQENNFRKGNLYFEIFTSDHQEVYNSVVENPLTEYLESADENGNMSTIKVMRDTALILIRSPYHQAINQISFFKIPSNYSRSRVVHKELQKIESIKINLKKEDE